MKIADTLRGMLGGKPPVEDQRFYAEKAVAARTRLRLTPLQVGRLTKAERLAFLASDQPLARHVSLSRSERRFLELPKGVPSRSRSVAPVAHPEAVDRFVEQAKPGSAQELVHMMGHAHGFSSPQAALTASLRAGRYIRSGRKGKIPAHIRERMIMSSACMLGVAAAFPESQPQAVLDAAVQMRADFGRLQASAA